MARDLIGFAPRERGCALDTGLSTSKLEDLLVVMPNIKILHHSVASSEGFHRPDPQSGHLPNKTPSTKPVLPASGKCHSERQQFGALDGWSAQQDLGCDVCVRLPCGIVGVLRTKEMGEAKGMQLSAENDCCGKRVYAWSSPHAMDGVTQLRII